MRNDMHKLLCERPRPGSREPAYRHKRGSRKRGPRDPENDGRRPKEGMTRPYGHDYKPFNEYLTPLYRWLWKQHGRPWDKVYADLVGSLPTGVHRSHLESHLYEKVDGVYPRGEATGHPSYLSHHLHTKYIERWNKQGDMYVNDAGILLRKRRRPS